MLASELVQWLALAFLASGSVLHWFNELAILGLIFAIGIAKTFEFTTRQALLPRLVPSPLLPRAMAANASAGRQARTTDTQDGVRRHQLHSPPAGSVGRDLSGFVRGAAGRRHGVGHIMFATVAGFGFATIVFAISTSFILSPATLCARGVFDMVSMVIRATLVQLETPDEMRGRVSAVNSIFINTSNQLGEFESSVTAAWFGTVPAVLIGGIGTLIVAVLWIRWFQALWHRDRLESDITA